MATTKEVVVVINGKETVSQAAEQAGASISIFGKKIPLMIDPLSLATKALDLAGKAFRAVSAWVADSLRAYDEFAASQRKLSGTAKLTGVALSELQDIAKRGTDGFKLSTVVANDFAAEIAKLTSKAGDLSKSKDAMGAFLDIGSARGLSASETLKAVQQAILGIDEGTDKLFGKNPSVIYKEYADRVGLVVGKMTDQQKAMALLDETMRGGEKVRGSYVDYLQSAAGQQELMNQNLEMSKARFGAALQPIRTLVLQGLNKLLDVLLPVAEWFAKVTNVVGVGLVQSFNRGREVTGNLVAALGRLTGNKALQQWGEDAAASARKSIESVWNTVAKSSEGVKASADVVSESVTRTESALRQQADSAERESKRVEKALSTSLGPPLARLIGMTEQSVRSLSEAAKDQLPADAAERFSAHMETLADNARKVGERITAVPPAIERGQRGAKDLANDITGVARAALDTAQAFGVVDANSASVLNSVLNIGGALSKIAGGDLFGGLSGVLGGVANIVSSMMQGDRERRELTRANTDALNRLRTEGVRLSNRASGEQLAGVAGLDADLLRAVSGARNSVERRAGTQAITSALAAQGLRLSDLDAVAAELGFNIRRDSGELELSQLPMLLQALRENLGALTRVGQSFREQFDFFKESQRLAGTTGTSEIAALLSYLQNVGGVKALGGIDLSDPAAAREQLRVLFTGLNNNVFGASDLGRLTGEQFRDVLLELIGKIDDLGAATETAMSGTTPETTAVVDSVGSVAVSVATVQDVISAMDAHVVDVLTSHTALQDRIAAATEGGLVHLQSIDNKMDTLIAATSGVTDRVNQGLAQSRKLTAANAGKGPSF